METYEISDFYLIQVNYSMYFFVHRCVCVDYASIYISSFKLAIEF